MTDRETYSSGTPWEAIVGYSRAVRVGNRVLVSGTTASTANGPVGGDNPAAQTSEAIRRIDEALRSLGSRIEHVVQTRIYVRRISDFDSVARAHGLIFGTIRPVTTLVEVSALVSDDLLVEIEAEAVIP